MIDRKWSAVLAMTLAVALAGAVWGDDPPVRWRVLTYNIHHGEGTDGRVDLPRIAAVIRSVDPDLVALQEVDRGTERTGRVDQPAELARLTGRHAAFEKNIDFQGGEYGNAILSRWPAETVHNERLPSHYQGEQRGALSVTVRRTESDPELTFLATHWDYRGDDAERLDSAEHLAAWITARGSGPAILAGDLNAQPESDVLQRVARHWFVATRQALLTFPAADPQRQIDYVALWPADAWDVVEVRVLDEPVASDHRPLLAVVQWLGADR